VLFAAGAPFSHPDPALNANTLSPFILDGVATERVRQFYGAGTAEPLLSNAERYWCRGIFQADHAVLDPALQRIRSRLFTIGNMVDTVVPPAGMAETLGPLDCLLPLGAHEYPFSLADVWQPGVTRSIVRSYNVLPSYEAGFRRFIEAIIDFLG
jgi:hypothetical protein